MRDLILSAAVTLDGFMAGPANDLDFMVRDDDLDQTMMTEELAARADTIVVGWKSFPDMAAYWTTATGTLARWMNDTPKVVLSNSLDDASTWPNSSVARGDGAAAVEELKRLPGRLRLMTFPLFAGDAGREPAFANVVSADLELVDHRVLDGRVLLVEYRPTGKDIPPA